jgi:hypothetical protein
MIAEARDGDEDRGIGDFMIDKGSLGNNCGGVQRGGEKRRLHFSLPLCRW